MSDEPKPKENGTEWSMPEPIFRSSEGHTPKARSYPAADEIDTLSPNADDQEDIDTEIPNAPNDRDEDTVEVHFDELDQDDIPTEIPNKTDAVEAQESSAGSEEIPASSGTPIPEKAAKPKGGCAKNVLMVIGVIAFVAVIVVVAALYLLSPLGTTETGTF